MRKHPPFKIIIPLLILLLIGYGIWRMTTNQNQLPEGAVFASGTIEATEVDVSSKVSGKIIKLSVDEGDRVEAGQVIAVLDAGEITAQVKQAQGQYDTAEARVQDLLKGTREEQIRQAQANRDQAVAANRGAFKVLNTLQKTYAKNSELKSRYAIAKANYESAQSGYDQAKARLAEIKAGSRPEEIQQAAASVDQAKAQYTNAAEDARRAEQLFKSGAISSQQRDTAITQRDTAEASLKAAQARYDEVKAGATLEVREQVRAAETQARAQLDGTRNNFEAIRDLYTENSSLKQQVESAQTQYETTGRQVAATQAQLDLLIAGPTKETVEAAQGQVTQAAGSLTAAEVTAGYLVIKAPVSGTVVLKNTEIGELVTSGMPIVRIANLDSVYVRVYAPLTELIVKIGDKADVATDTYANKYFPGVVTEISDTPEFTPKNVQTKEERVKLVYGIKIKLDNKAHELKPGMPADATIYASR